MASGSCRPYLKFQVWLKSLGAPGSIVDLPRDREAMLQRAYYKLPSNATLDEINTLFIQYFLFWGDALKQGGEMWYIHLQEKRNYEWFSLDWDSLKRKLKFGDSWDSTYKRIREEFFDFGIRIARAVVKMRKSEIRFALKHSRRAESSGRNEEGEENTVRMRGGGYLNPAFSVEEYRPLEVVYKNIQEAWVNDLKDKVGNLFFELGVANTDNMQPGFYTPMIEFKIKLEVMEEALPRKIVQKVKIILNHPEDEDMVVSPPPGEGGALEPCIQC